MSYLLCQLTYDFDYVLMLSLPLLHFPYYLPDHQQIKPPFPFCPLCNPVITTHIPFPRIRLFSRSPCSPWLPWHYLSRQSYMHNPNPGNLFSELLSKLFFFVWWFFPLVCFGRDWRVWGRKQNWGMSQQAEEKLLGWVGNCSSVLTSVCDLLGELLYLAWVIGVLQCTVTTVEYVC